MPKRNDPLVEEIGRRIYKKRKEMGLTQDELADRSGLSQSFLTCIERGEKGPGCDSIIRISQALEVSTDYLLKGLVTKEESDYIHSLFALMTEAQRGQATVILQTLLRFGGITLPEGPRDPILL